MIRRSLISLLAVSCLIAGCSTPPQPAQSADSLVPGTIGIAVQRVPAGVVVTAIRKDSRAAAAGLRVGDIVLRYNGEAVTDSRQFYRLVIDSRPGSRARLELLRDGAVHQVEVPVEQIDTTPRA